MKPERAETIALMALTWLLSEEELCGTFLNATGAAPAELAMAAQDAAFLAGVLEFITREDRWVIDFCDSHHLRYEEPLAALQALPGAASVHWT